MRPLTCFCLLDEFIPIFDGMGLTGDRDLCDLVTKDDARSMIYLASDARDIDGIATTVPFVYLVLIGT